MHEYFSHFVVGINVAFNHFANFKTKRRIRFTGCETITIQLFIQVLANKDEPRFTRFIFCPVNVTESTIEVHSHALEDELMRHSLYRYQPLVPIEFGAVFSNESLDPSLKHGHVYTSLKLDRYTADSGVVLSWFTKFIQKIFVQVESPPHVKGLDVDKILGINFPIFTASNGTRWVDGLDRFFNLPQFLFRRKIHLVQQNFICKCNLCFGFVNSVRWLFFVETLDNVFAINNGDDCVQAEKLLDVFVNEKGLTNRGRIRHSSSLNDNTVKLIHSPV
mmetsp:Transcript_36690/g.88993  ORF Transcript_36690/g.88993 Transcript_36690/m.88993 type:complete len:276 (-) Transcript_36690:266-1093(-)